MGKKGTRNLVYKNELHSVWYKTLIPHINILQWLENVYATWLKKTEGNGSLELSFFTFIKGSVYNKL